MPFSVISNNYHGISRLSNLFHGSGVERGGDILFIREVRTTGYSVSVLNFSAGPSVNQLLGYFQGDKFVRRSFNMLNDLFCGQ